MAVLFIFPVFDVTTRADQHLDLLKVYLDDHIGVGLREGVVVEGGDLGASEVANLITHASLPFSSRTCSQSPFTSRILREVPFLTLPITLWFIPGPSRKFTKSHTTCVKRSGGGGVGITGTV
jgi:hypothetical protein